MLISIDFETRSKVDIKKTGVHRYVEDPSTEILCMAWMPEGSEPALWLPGQPFPKQLHKFVRNEFSIFCAWNAEFEIQVWNQIGAIRHGFPFLTAERWHDTMGDAAMCSFPLALDECAKALGTIEQKDARGKRLINKLSKPRRGGTFYSYDEARDDYLELYQYCLQDVRTEADIYRMLPDHVNGTEAKIQRLTWLSNERGVPIDHVSVRLIKNLIDSYIEHLCNQISKHTDGVIIAPTQRQRIKDYVSIELPDMQGDTLEPVMEGELSDSDRFLLECYIEANHASVAKFKRILLQLCKDNTVKSNIQYHGAGTGRDAARGFQLQNLPRFTLKDPEQMLTMFETFDVDVLVKLFPILKTASGLIRPMIMAPPGMKLVVSDFSQIEAVGTAWTAKELDILQNFRDGVDPYIAQAADMYNIPRSKVDAQERQYGKIAVLAGGYQGSHKALMDQAPSYGLELERKEAVAITRMFRSSRPFLVNAWGSFSEAAIHAVKDAGVPYNPRDCAPCTFQMQGEHLTMLLPSGRKIWYPYAEIKKVTVRYEDPETGEPKSFKTTAMTCMWVSSYTHKWERRSMSGGNLFQNYVQAICRDLLMEALIRCEEHGYEIIGRIHDELIALVPDDPRYTIEEMNRLMAQQPTWAPDFPIRADGYEDTRYHK